MKRMMLVGAVLLSACRSTPETPPLTTGDILQMSKADIAPNVIIERIRVGGLEAEEMTPRRIIQLHQEGLDPQVLAALVRAAAGEDVPPYVPPAPPEEEGPP